MNKRIRTAIVLAPLVAMLGAGVVGAAPASAGTIVNCTLGSTPIQNLRLQYEDAVEKELGAQINAFRAANGRGPVVVTGSFLSRAAQWASNDSAARGFSPKNHIDTLERDIPTRFAECGVAGYGQIAEINYYGQGGTVPPSQALHWWTVESPKLGLQHREILLNPAWKSIGIGRAVNGDKVHWTVTFGDKYFWKKLRKSTG